MVSKPRLGGSKPSCGLPRFALFSLFMSFVDGDALHYDDVRIATGMRDDVFGIAPAEHERERTGIPIDPRLALPP